jgi:hypothetical protein
MMPPRPDAVVLLLSDYHGIYLPHKFATTFDLSKYTGLKDESIRALRGGPQADNYWEAWTDVLDNARMTSHGLDYVLYQDGDLWALCVGRMTKEERRNFGMGD